MLSQNRGSKGHYILADHSEATLTTKEVDVLHTIAKCIAAAKPGSGQSLQRVEVIIPPKSTDAITVDGFVAENIIFGYMGAYQMDGLVSITVSGGIHATDPVTGVSADYETHIGDTIFPASVVITPLVNESTVPVRVVVNAITIP